MIKFAIYGYLALGISWAITMILMNAEQWWAKVGVETKFRPVTRFVSFWMTIALMSPLMIVLWPTYAYDVLIRKK